MARILAYTIAAMVMVYSIVIESVIGLVMFLVNTFRYRILRQRIKPLPHLDHRASLRMADVTANFETSPHHIVVAILIFCLFIALLATLVIAPAMKLKVDTRISPPPDNSFVLECREYGEFLICTKE